MGNNQLTKNELKSIRSKILNAPEVKEIKKSFASLAYNHTNKLVKSENNSKQQLDQNLKRLFQEIKKFARNAVFYTLSAPFIYKIVMTDCLHFYALAAQNRDKKEVKSGVLSREEIISRALGRDFISKRDAFIMGTITVLGGSGKDPFIVLPGPGFMGSPLENATFENNYNAVKVMGSLPGLSDLFYLDFEKEKLSFSTKLEKNERNLFYIENAFFTETPRVHFSYEDLKYKSLKELQKELSGVDLFEFIQSVKTKEFLLRKYSHDSSNYKNEHKNNPLSGALTEAAIHSRNPIDYKLLFERGAKLDYDKEGQESFQIRMAKMNGNKTFVKYVEEMTKENDKPKLTKYRMEMSEKTPTMSIN